MSDPGWHGGGPKWLSEQQLETQGGRDYCWAASIANALVCSGIDVDQDTVIRLKDKLPEDASDDDVTEIFDWVLVEKAPRHDGKPAFEVQFHELQESKDIMKKLQDFWDKGSGAIVRPSPAVIVEIDGHAVLVAGIDTSAQYICGYDSWPNDNTKRGEEFNMPWDSFIKEWQPSAVWLLGQVRK